MYRHGDLSFHSVKKAPGDPIEYTDRYVLAVGEHTNHKHVITPKGGNLEIRKDGNVIYLIIDGEAELTHEEHKPITLMSGMYEMKHEREYDYFLETVRDVAD